MTLDDLLASPDPAVKAAADAVAAAKADLDRGMITKSEYEALVKSATDLGVVAGIAKDIVRAEYVKMAFNQLLSIAVTYL